jgi:hypothetical protein
MCLKDSKKFAPLVGVCLKHIKQHNHDQKKLKALLTNLMYTNPKKKKKKIEKTRDATSQPSLHHQTSQIAI